MRNFLLLMVGLAILNSVLYFYAPTATAASSGPASIATMNQGKVAVYFGATWCGPCRKAKPVFNELAGEMSGCSFLVVDVDQEKELAQKFEIRSIPMIVVLNDGKEKGRFNGSPDKAGMKQQIEENL